MHLSKLFAIIAKTEKCIETRCYKYILLKKTIDICQYHNLKKNTIEIDLYYDLIIGELKKDIPEEEYGFVDDVIEFFIDTGNEHKENKQPISSQVHISRRDIVSFFCVCLTFQIGISWFFTQTMC
jgi:hypothetical protein